MPLNKAAGAAAEAAEERGLAEGNADGPTRPGHRAGPGVPSGLDRVREVARRDKNARFTALLHHVSLDRLVLAYWDLSPKAAPGVDGVTWQDYGQDLVANLRDLHDRVHSGRYRARPSRRAYIPKADGRLRPLGIAAPGGQDRPGGPSPGCSTPSTRRTSWVSPTGSGQGAARMTRWMRWRPGSARRR